MENSAKESVRMLAEALAAYGVTDIFTSPGSRNAPVLMALARREELALRSVIDERSAAFIALGYALVAQKPVALVCTSGSAMLNYAPAIAEAYYRKIPLIAITADRPARWIGQDDSQTIRQPGALDNFVKQSFSIRGEIGCDQDRWLVNRNLNEALQMATDGRPGPVHINIELDEPLTSTIEDPLPSFRKVELLRPDTRLPASTAKLLADEAFTCNTLIVGGFNQPSANINRAMASLTRLGGVAVVADALANVNAPGVLSRPDLLLDSPLLAAPEAAPKLLITFGGGLLSRKLKEYLRATPFTAHWHIGTNDSLIDSYFSLTRRIEIPAEDFFPRFANAMLYLSRRHPAPGNGVFAETWRKAAAETDSSERAAVGNGGWCERYAVAKLMQKLPAEWNMQFSNGLTPRLATVSDADRFHRRDCNRGVSGIDGSTSTALGASLAYRGGITCLITGDMSMQYDIGALASTLLTPRLKIVVISNGGGGIFRKISATRNLPERERLLCGGVNLPVEKLAEAYGFRYLEASSAAGLDSAIAEMIAEDCAPVILNLEIPCRQPD